MDCREGQRGYFVWVLRRDPEQDDAALRWQAAVVCQLSEILVEGQKGPISRDAKGEHFVIRRSRVGFGNPKYIKAGLAAGAPDEESSRRREASCKFQGKDLLRVQEFACVRQKIGRASCRERVYVLV